MKQTQKHDLQRLMSIIERLRGPDGCMWDRQQDTKSVAPYLIEEAYEVLDAADEGTPDDLKEELGDLLFQILFLVKISEENGGFDISDVIKAISEKMIRRHPHVFGNARVKDVEEIKANWKDIKTREEGKEDKSASFFHSIPRSLPALWAAKKITEKASEVGFDWADIEGVIEKIDEEITELKTAIQSKNHDQIHDEIGDVLFSLVNLSRFLDVNPEAALRSTINKFIRRFSYMDTKFKEQGKDLSSATFEEMDDLWNRSKKYSI